MRRNPNILITGTPGTGKSTLARKVADNVHLQYIDATSIIKENKFFTEYDSQLDTYVLDEDAFLDHLEQHFGSDGGGFLLDYHSAELFPKRWFDIVVVLRCETAPLYDRLTERGYSERKRRENMDCEIFGVIAEEANQSYDQSIVHELENSTPKQLEANVRTLTALVGQFTTDGREK